MQIQTLLIITHPKPRQFTLTTLRVNHPIKQRFRIKNSINYPTTKIALALPPQSHQMLITPSQLTLI